MATAEQPPVHARPSLTEEAETNDNRPKAEHFPTLGRSRRLSTAASSIDRLENQENIMAQDEDDPRARHAKEEREHAEAKRGFAGAKWETARVKWASALTPIDPGLLI